MPNEATRGECPYPIHELAKCIPGMGGEEYAQLVESISANGMLEPVVVHEEQILDGRHRGRAAQEAGAEIRYRELNGGMAAGEFIIAKNLTRRHLTVGQRAMSAVALSQHTKNGRPRKDAEGMTTGEAARYCHLDERQVRRAREVASQCAEAVVDAVRTGEVSLGEAWAEGVRNADESMQEQALEARRNGEVRTLQEWIARHGPSETPAAQEGDTNGEDTGADGTEGFTSSAGATGASTGDASGNGDLFGSLDEGEGSGSEAPATTRAGGQTEGSSTAGGTPEGASGGTSSRVSSTGTEGSGEQATEGRASGSQAGKAQRGEITSGDAERARAALGTIDMDAASTARTNAVVKADRWTRGDGGEDLDGNVWLRINGGTAEWEDRRVAQCLEGLEEGSIEAVVIEVDGDARGRPEVAQAIEHASRVAVGHTLEGFALAAYLGPLRGAKRFEEAYADCATVLARPERGE